MKPFILTIAILSSCFGRTNAQSHNLTQCPTVSVAVKLREDTFKYGNDILIKIILRNKTNSTQMVWFDNPKSSTGGPAWTSVILTNTKTGQSVLKYQNKAILESQLHSTDEIKRFSYKLKPGRTVSGQFSLLDLVVLLDYKQKLDKGNYDMQIFYCIHPSDRINFTVN